MLAYILLNQMVKSVNWERDIGKYINLCCNCSYAESCEFLVCHDNPKKVCERFKLSAKAIHTVMVTKETQDSALPKSLCDYCKNASTCKKNKEGLDVQDCADFLLMDY